MNAERRKEIDKLIGIVEQAKADAEQLQNDEQEAFDNMPEGLQQGEKGQASSDAADKLGEVVSNFEQIVTDLEEAKGDG